MIRSNRHGWLALATGNKSELAVGYCTLYGDMAVGFAVLCDVFERDVYAVSRYINETLEARMIPEGSLVKSPSRSGPERVRPGHASPYALLDAILEGLIEREMRSSPRERDPAKRSAGSPGISTATNSVRANAPGDKAFTTGAFGSGRRMPMAARITGQ